MSQNSKTPQQNTAHVKREKETTNNSLFCYQVDEVRIFIESGIKMEILEQSIVYPIPNAPKWYSGVTSLRGDILTVVNMHVLLGTTPMIKSKRLLKLEHADFPPLVIAIDHLPYQSTIDTLLENTHSNTKQYPEWVISSSIQNNYTFLFADHAALFNAMQNNLTTSYFVGDN